MPKMVTYAKPIKTYCYLYAVPKVLITIFLIFASCQKACKAHGYSYIYNDNCKKAYQCYLSLRPEEARNYILNEIKVNPYNLMATYVEDYGDCILLLLNCNKADYKAREQNFDARLELLDKGDRSSPWYRFCKAGLYLHWAFVNTRFNEQYTAAVRMHKSFSLLKENKEQFPGFDYNNTFMGLQQAVIGAIPGNYKWIAAIFGMKGSIKNGVAMLGNFLAAHKANDLMYPETVFYYLYTRFYLAGQQAEVWDYLAGDKFLTRNNLLNTFVKANLAIDNRKSPEAIEVLKAAEGYLDYSSYPIFDYEMGVALLMKCDTGCIRYFQSYLGKNKSPFYTKDCWQKMAFAWYMSGNKKQAGLCRDQIAKNGAAQIDADKQAQKFAETGRWPVKELLKARMLTEGGYNTEAIKILSSIDTTTLIDAADKVEYYYRYGRAFEEANKHDAALAYYRQCILSGSRLHEQFAARSALQMGRIYEQDGQKTLALNLYRECLDMPAHDFQNSIDQQARAGLNRLENN